MMVLPTQNLVSEVLALRSQGLTDNLIMEELKSQGYTPPQVSMAIAQADSPSPSFQDSAQYAGPASGYAPSGSDEGNIYERIEEFTENLVDQKWDELIAEVKKIVSWKEKMESQQQQLQNDVTKLKEDFKVLHQGVLGQLEEYDTRMRDVGTELKAVGKVFKDVIPEFVQNVKDLKSITQLKGSTQGKK